MGGLTTSKPIRRPSKLLDRLADVDAPGMHPARRADAGDDGLDLQNRLIERGSMLPIVFVTGHADTPTAVRAIKGGAEDFLAKPASFGRSDRRDRARMARGLFHPPSTERAWFASPAGDDPDAARATGLRLIVRGKINKQVAFELGTVERTVKAHRHQIMEKMQG